MPMLAFKAGAIDTANPAPSPLVARSPVAGIRCGRRAVPVKPFKKVTEGVIIAPSTR
jgi:hypothetical protein